MCVVDEKLIATKMLSLKEAALQMLLWMYWQFPDFHSSLSKMLPVEPLITIV